MRVSDLQSDSDLDSISNSRDVFFTQKLVFVLAKKNLFPPKNYFCRMDEIDVDHLDQQILTLIELSTSVDYTTGLLQDRIEMN